MASFVPRGPGYDPRLRLRRRLIVLRGGEDAIVVAFGWVAGAVRLKVLAHGACASEDVERAISVGRAVTAVDDDPTSFLSMVERHPLLGPLARRSDTRLATTPTLFESFAVAVIEQLVTLAEAKAAIGRLWRAAGEPVPSTQLRAAPTARSVARVPLWSMHAMGIGSRRAATLHALACRANALEGLRAHAPEIAIEKMQSLRGVGPWTANAVARSGLGWTDAVPVGDFHAPYTVTAALGGDEGISRDEPRAADAAMLRALEPFRPHRARVALLLERHVPSGARPWRVPRVDPHRREPWRY